MAARLSILLTLILGTGLLLGNVWVGEHALPKTPQHLARRLPADFEAQVLVLPWNGLEAIEPGLAAKIVSAVEGRLQVALLVNQASECEQALSRQVDSKSADSQLRCWHIAHDTAWIRDYGPLSVVDRNGRFQLIDPEYYLAHRQRDIRVPAQLAAQLSLKHHALPVMLSGGNLLSNGQGLVLATYDLVGENLGFDLDEGEIREILAREFGVEQLVLLEPLKGEITGHVDVFATFPAFDTVVVGSYLEQVDATNAAILDRNAKRLSQVKVAGKLLRVERIAMPPHMRDVWPTYTNVIYANGVLVMPRYQLFDVEGRQAARATYERLLPGWKIVEIDAWELVRQEGALRCASLALPAWNADSRQAPAQP